MCLSRVTLRLEAEEGDRAFLRLWWDGREQLIEMYPSDALFEATVTLPDRPGNLWYSFFVDRADGRLWYGNAPDGQGGEGALYAEEPPGYQITVYDPNYRTPEWMRGAILYQIMVDRFCASRPAGDREPPYMGWLHEDWYEPPALRRGGPDGDQEANDFFGGNLAGVMSKFPYFEALGVTALYFNPIFRARSNHKYDTGDYHEVDPSFGDEADFRALCATARARGMRVLLDGVFSHTGADSRYFNIRGAYDSVGAYQSKDSPYARWYSFEKWPDKYACWWGFPTLPNVRELEESYLDFIIRDPDAVCAFWVRAGASGWRLDVADELPMVFLRLLRERVKRENPDACLLGEVWEDASNKLTYGEARNYSAGDTLDSVMNYPLRDGVIGFMTGQTGAPQFARMYEHLQENYAPPFFYSLMNMLGSHDKPRIIDVLSGVGELEPPREKRRARRLTRAQYRLGSARFVAAWQLVCALPGMPCLYYADEAGQTGMADPFCRGTYPWGKEDRALLKAVGAINRARLASDALKTGELRLYAPSEDVLVIARRIARGRDALGKRADNALVLCAVNRSGEAQSVHLERDEWLPRALTLTIEPISARLIEP
ncbi:MAG: glycoside hydrolase family 13 protein [Christensenellaceae bacterium]|nr:glycoside hydrolase family 13 protein [Christensenellaceae bacterium]